MNSMKWKDLFEGKGQMFTDVVAFRQTLYRYGIRQKFSYKFKKNNMKKVIAKCKVEGCPWNIAAHSIGKHSDFLRVTRFNSEHIHNAKEKLIVSYRERVDLSSPIIADALRSTIDKSTNEIRRDLYKEEIDVTTVVKWEASDSNRFERLLIAYGYYILGFLEGCRHILYIDGCFLSYPYKGTLLATSAYDTDNDLFPLAYAIVSGETFEDWSWFLRNVEDITRSVEIILVFDRHNAIIRAMQAIFGGERHAYCYCHVKENFSTEYVKINRGQRRTSGNSKEAALKLLDAVAYARHEEKFNIAMGNLRLFSPQLA
ncbi:uncharacterized protein LOC129316438 [Prosopis cineraria]|uniref:uncharacterized protein LOC129316438 n=1 Tax=Prosopis cineraria TaxID=364024 RepID=UPI002410AA5F|nr:uncharacterized protein LOC129316438 [Prosopis cineraria]